MAEKSPLVEESLKEEDVIFITKNLTNSGDDGSSHTIYHQTPKAYTQKTTFDSLPAAHLHQHLLSETPAHLFLSAENLHVIISTGSGTGKAEEFFDNALKPVLEGTGLVEGKYRVMRTEDEESARRFARDVLKPQAESGVQQTVMLLAGDGATVDIVNVLQGGGERSSTYVRPTLILFPLGTGNALFHSLHRPASPPSPSPFTLALRALLHGTPKPLPTFRASFSPAATLLTNEGRTALPIPSNTLFGAVVASYGFHATLVADSDTASWRQHGSARFGMVAQQLLTDPTHRYQARVTLRKKAGAQVEDLVIPRTEHGYVLGTLVSNLEATFTISPASKPLDGKLRVVHFGPENAEAVMRIMGAAYAGGAHVGDVAVGYEEVEGFRVEVLGGEEQRWRRVCVDGLIVGLEEGGWMDVQMGRGVEEGGVDVVL